MADQEDIDEARAAFAKPQNPNVSDSDFRCRMDKTYLQVIDATVLARKGLGQECSRQMLSDEVWGAWVRVQLHHFTVMQSVLKGNPHVAESAATQVPNLTVVQGGTQA